MKNGELMEFLNNYPLDYEIIIDGSNLFVIEESGNQDKKLLFIKK